jgi:type III secretion protein T
VSGLVFEALRTHVEAVALIAARLVPICFLCPLLGGQSLPSFVRLSLALSLSGAVHFAGGLQAPAIESVIDLGALAMKEVVLGAAIGLLASLPFDAMRMGGRFIDLLRGTSAEAALPMAGTREAASGDLLYQLAVATASAGVALPLILGALFKSFAVVKLGGFVPREEGVMLVASLAGGAMAAGLAIGAPIAAVALGTDCLVGMLSRAVPNVGLQELASPLKILGGGAVLWLTLGLLGQRALDLLGASETHLIQFLEVVR